jgi:hypothetical protein
MHQDEKKIEVVSSFKRIANIDRMEGKIMVRWQRERLQMLFLSQRGHEKYT